MTALKGGTKNTRQVLFEGPFGKRHLRRNEVCPNAICPASACRIYTGQSGINISFSRGTSVSPH